MGFRPGAYATVWEVKSTDYPTVKEVKLTTSRKNKQTEEWETDFSGYCRFVGDANSGASKLSKGTRIKLGDCEATRKYSKEAAQAYVTFVVYDFEIADSKTAPKKEVDDPVEGDIDEDNMPF